MADYYQLKNQNIFNPPPNTDMGNVDSQYNSIYVQNALVLGNVSVTGTTIIAPRVSSIAYPGNDTAADTAGGQTITLNGTGFVAGASVLINGSAVGVVSVVSSTVITFTSPANTTGSYVVYVINPDGSTAIAIPGIQYSGTPTWTTAAGTLGNVYETASFNQTVTATGDAPITYSVVSGSLPPGSTFNSNGTITGTSQLSASPTTYSFTVRATDAEQQDTNRAFSIAVIPDVVTWSSPTNNATYSPAANVAIANITLSATSAVGSGITYSANTLPTGLSLTGANISGTPTVVATTSSLLTATANTTSESSSITINWVVSVASDPYFMYNSLLLPGTGTNGAQNNTFLDGSTNNFTVTRNGNTTQGTFSPYGPNWSNFFNGASQLSFSTNSGYAFGTGDFTVECWYYATSNPGYRSLIETRSSNGTTTGWALAADSGGAMYVYANGFILTGITIVLNTWNHVAFTRSGSTQRLFLNGSLVSSTTDARTYSDTNLGIGGVAYTTGEYWTGYLSNVRLIKGTCLYTTTFTPSTTPLTAVTNTTMLTCQSNRFIDNSTTNATITAGTGVTVQRFSPFSPGATYSTSTIGGSGYFDGTGDNILSASTTAFNLSTNPFSIEMWFYYTGGSSGYSGLCGSATDYKIAMSIWNSRIMYGASSTGSSWNILSAEGSVGSNTIIPNQWNHLVLCRTGNTFSGFLNGSRDITTTSSAAVISRTEGYTVGAWFSTLYYFSGYISNFRFIVGSNPYDATASTITVPTAPVTAITNTQLLTNFTNAGIIDNTMLNNLETVGNAQISTAQTKFGSGSMSFDGTEDHLSTYNPSYSLSVGSGDFTFECWLYLNSLPSFSAAVYHLKNDAGLATTVFDLEITPAGAISVSTGTALIATGTSGKVTTGSWIHFAFVRTSGVFKTFFNGTQDISISNSTTYNGTYLQIGAFRYSAYYSSLNGYIDDLRITKGYARYTSNFTPPTSAFPTY